MEIVRILGEKMEGGVFIGEVERLGINDGSIFFLTGGF